MSIDKIQEEVRLQKLFTRTFKHAILGAKAQWVSLEWLLEIANPTPSDQAKLTDNETLADQEELWRDMEKKGMRDPFIIACGSLEGRVRLETGNHRLRALIAKGILHAPAVALLAENAWVDKENGQHEGKKLTLWATQPEAPLGIYSERVYLKPSHLIPSCPAFDQKGFLEDAKAVAKKDLKSQPVKGKNPKEEPKMRRSRAEKPVTVKDTKELLPESLLPATEHTEDDGFLTTDFNFDE